MLARAVMGGCRGALNSCKLVARRLQVVAITYSVVASWFQGCFQLVVRVLLGAS